MDLLSTLLCPLSGMYLSRILLTLPLWNHLTLLQTLPTLRVCPVNNPQCSNTPPLVSSTLLNPKYLVSNTLHLVRK